jgi:hypothetical protein
VFASMMDQFWSQWPDRVESHVSSPAVSFCYGEGRGSAAVNCARSGGRVGVTADPGLAMVYHTLCNELGLYGQVRQALAVRVFSDRLHFVYPESGGSDA